MRLLRCSLATAFFVAFATSLDAQLPVPQSLAWRNIGPNRGGRSIAAAGSAQRPFEYYFGATGGGLWKTTDGGTTWSPVTDGKIASSSVGAVAVAPSNPDVIYLGMGETELRGNIMQGDGIYKSTDAGKTWRNIGLKESQSIGRIVVDPNNPDIVFVTVLGHPYGDNVERGVYRTTDGGVTWKQILKRDTKTGAVDIAMDPSNPRVLYASLWQVYRKPWILWSGGSGSGLFKSTDGGDTWTEITRNAGLPGGVIGKIMLAVSPADTKRVYANIEANEGGLYRSDDAGATWTRINGHRDLWQRSFYFMRVVADPKDRETVYVMNFGLFKSTDGGKSYREIPTRHVDHHDLWVDPTNPQRMINANDGGASVSVNGGATWTEQDYPTAQIYRVATTNDMPYHVCGGQQDNTTVCVASDGGFLHDPEARIGDWYYEVAGGENGVIAADPKNPDIFYSNETNSLARYDRRTGTQTDVQPYPRLVMGEPAKVMPERWNWTYPIAISPADSTTLYAGSQHLWRSKDAGKTWQKISGDLTRADTTTMGDSGGPIIFDQDGPEIYATIFTIAPSPIAAQTIWVGSDDGLVHVTRDGGATWQNVTPRDARPFTRISRIDASPHDAGTAFVAGNRNQLDDRAPYIWVTHDYGKTWTSVTKGIRADDFVHAVRQDTKRADLLYAATEHGVYTSFDGGANWQSLSLNLPDVQASDLVVKDNDLVIATHGRSFYVLPDISPLRQMTANVTASRAHLFAPSGAVRRVQPGIVDYYLRDAAQSVRLEIIDSTGALVSTLAAPTDARTRTAGFHRYRWTMRYPGSTVFPGIVLEGGDPSVGPWAPPGTYQTRLIVDGDTLRQSFRLTMDPRLPASAAAAAHAQFDLAAQIRDKTSQANEAVLRIRALRQRIETNIAASHDDGFIKAGRALLRDLAAVEGNLYQVRNQSPKDKIAFPIKLNNRLSGLRWNLEKGDDAPAESYYRVFRELSRELDDELNKLNQILEKAEGKLWK